LMAVELRQRLEEAFGVELSATVAFDYPSVRALSEHLISLQTQGQGPSGDQARLVEQEAVRDRELYEVAIVGMEGRFGTAQDVDGFFSVLAESRGCVAEISKQRFDIDEVFDPRRGVPGKSYTRHASLLERVDLFDAEFFNISGKEAQGLDPNQRLLLEVVYHALEGANIAVSSLQNTRTGVFVGVCFEEYSELARAQGFDKTNRYVTVTGSGSSFAAGRISFTLGCKAIV